MYNMDERDFSIDEIEAGKYIFNAKIRQQFQAKSVCQEWVTSMEYICENETTLSSLIIFTTENLS